MANKGIEIGPKGLIKLRLKSMLGFLNILNPLLDFTFQASLGSVFCYLPANAYSGMQKVRETSEAS